MRAFIGIWLPDEARRAVAHLQNELAASQADVKWVDPPLLHLTLKFLDEISETQRVAVEQLLFRIAHEEPSFQLELKGVGAFPSSRAPRVVWAGIEEGKAAVTRIAEAIEREGAAISLRKEERPFSAHLTIGRVRSLRGRSALAQQLETIRWEPPAPWRVSSLTLYQSVLSSSGPTYTALADFRLQTSDSRHQ